MERVTTAGILIDDGKVLIAKREEGGALSGKWEFPGGKNRYGESVGDTLRREWMEELSVAVQPGEEILSFDFENGETLYHLKCCRVYADIQGYALSVHSRIGFASKDTLLSYDFGPSDRKIAEYLVSAIL